MAEKSKKNKKRELRRERRDKQTAKKKAKRARAKAKKEERAEENRRERQKDKRKKKAKGAAAPNAVKEQDKKGKKKARREKRRAESAPATVTSSPEPMKKKKKNKRNATEPRPEESVPTAAQTRAEKRKSKRISARQRKKAASLDAVSPEGEDDTEQTSPKSRKMETPGLSADEFPMQRLPGEDETFVEFSSIDAIDLRGFSKGRFTVNSEGVPFHAYFQRSQYKRLFVLLDSATSRKESALPVFERRGLALLMPGNILCISDPTSHVSDDVTMGWYVGTHERDYTRLMAQLVDRVAKQLDIRMTNVVFYASSGGGFASLMCARLLPGANCIVVNPQIEIAKHGVEEHREQFGRAFSGDANFETVSQEHSERLSVLEAFPDAASLPPTVYVQNSKDTSHFKEHYEVFCEAYSAPKEGGIGAGGRVLTLVFDHEVGHGPEPRQLVRPLLAEALAFFERFARSSR